MGDVASFSASRARFSDSLTTYQLSERQKVKPPEACAATKDFEQPLVNVKPWAVNVEPHAHVWHALCVLHCSSQGAHIKVFSRANREIAPIRVMTRCAAIFRRFNVEERRF